MIARLWWLVDRRALLVTAACLLVWRMLEQITFTGVPAAFVSTHLSALPGSGFFAALGPHSLPLASYSIGSLGIRPYVNALVIVSLVATVSTRIRAHALGRWTRALALVLALGQAYGLTVVVQNVGGLPSAIDWSQRLAVCIELTAGTAIMILVSDVMDEYGLGFGSGALILFALGPLAGEVHRLMGYIATWPSFDALARPLAVWTVFSVAVTVAGVAIVLAVRRVVPPAAKGANDRVRRIDISMLTSGVLRPTGFAFAVLFLPTLVANYYVPVSDAAQWFTANWSPYSESPWLAAAYLAAEAVLIVVLAAFVAGCDTVLASTPAWLSRNMVLLGLVGGLFLAAIVTFVPVADHYATGRAGTVIPVSGIDALLIVAMILIVVRSIEGHVRTVPFTASPSGLP